MSAQRKKFITSIQVLRGVASCCIVIYHAQSLVTNYAARGVFDMPIIDFRSSMGFWRTLPPESFIIFAAVICVSAGWISFRLAEMPLINLCTALFLPDRPAGFPPPKSVRAKDF